METQVTCHDCMRCVATLLSWSIGVRLIPMTMQLQTSILCHGSHNTQTRSVMQQRVLPTIQFIMINPQPSKTIRGTWPYRFPFILSEVHIRRWYALCYDIHSWSQLLHQHVVKTFSKNMLQHLELWGPTHCRQLWQSPCKPTMPAFLTKNIAWTSKPWLKKSWKFLCIATPFHHRWCT